MANIIKQLKDSNGNNIYPIAYAQGGMKIDLLWTNPSPTSAFSAQTLSIDMNNYNMIFVIATSRTDLDVRFSSSFKVGSYTARLCSTFTGTNVYTTRNVNLTPTSLGFEGGYNGSTANNSYCIPMYIYGIKMSYIVPTTVNGLQYVEV